MKRYLLLLFSIIFSQTQWSQVDIPDNQNMEKLIAVGNGLYGATSAASVYYSSDNGLNWESLPMHPDIFPYGVDLFEKVDDYLFFSQNIGGSTYNYRIHYNGENWEDWEILPYDESVIYEFVHYDNTIYALLNQGISISYDYGITWELIEAPEISGYIHLQYVNDEYLYINHGCNLYRYSIETYEWTDITGILDEIGPPEPYNCTAIHKIEKFNDKLIISMYWYGGVGVLFSSEDHGDSWEEIDSFPSISNSGYGHNNVSAMATQNGTLYAGTASSQDGIFYTQNLMDWAEYSTGLNSYNLSVSTLAVTEEKIYKLGGTVNLFQNALIESGCTDPEACNYDELATEDDGSCAYEVDCAGMCGGELELDCAGICGGNNSTYDNCCGIPPNEDCSDVCIMDEMGVCCILEDLDECEICDGDNSCLCDAPFMFIHGHCLHQDDIDVLQTFIDNSLYSGFVMEGCGNSNDPWCQSPNLYMDQSESWYDVIIDGVSYQFANDNGSVEPLELGLQDWVDGRLTSLMCGAYIYCQLSGEIPENISDLTDIEVLRLEVNYYSGTIPESVCEFENIDFSDYLSFNFSYNMLCPPYPECVEDGAVEYMDTDECEGCCYEAFLANENCDVGGGCFIPQCTENCEWESIQCWGSTGYCWCVDDNGIEIEGTSQPSWEGLPACEEIDLGDINGDGIINVIDIVLTVGLILEASYDAVGDVNEDGLLNVIDVVMLVNWVLNGTGCSDGSSWDYDMDGICDVDDVDDDNDGASDPADSDDNNEYVCSDIDVDSCDDCSSGTFDPANDGPDYNGNGICDEGEDSNDTDGDGVIDDEDYDPYDPYVCSDNDGDTCDDCSAGYYDTSDDGFDYDSDGACDAGDSDDDNDGCLDSEDESPHEWDNDYDGDGMPDDCDCDDDNDGCQECWDYCP